MSARTVYGVKPVDDTHTGTAYYTRKADAMACARQVARDGCEAIVEAIVVTRSLPGVRLFAALLNHQGWSDSSTTIAVFPAKKVELE
jgi:hypothetical protein